MSIYKIIEDIPILYINLDRAIDRKNKMEDILVNNNLNFTRIPAIDGSALNKVELKKMCNYRKISNNEVACALSHLKAIQYALDNNYENVLIFEDDCSFEYLEYKKETLKELMKTNNEWEIIQLGLITDENTSNYLIKLFEENNFIKSSYYYLGAVAYVINKKGMMKIINNFLKTKNISIADEYIYKLTNTYLTIPYFTQYSNVFKSDIRENLSYQDKSKEIWDLFVKNNS